MKCIVNPYHARRIADPICLTSEKDFFMTHISLQRVSRSASAVAVAAVSLFSSAALAQEEPTAATALLFLSPEEQTEVFKNTDLVFPAREIRAGETVRALSSAVQDLSELSYTVGETSYRCIFPPQTDIYRNRSITNEENIYNTGVNFSSPSAVFREHIFAANYVFRNRRY